MSHRIGIDCRFAATHAGLGRYTRSLVTALLRRADGFDYVLFIRSLDEAWLRDVPRCDRVTADFAHYSFGEQICLPKIIEQQQLDVFFAPHFNVPLSLSVPTVVTIHDLILHRYPNQASLPKRLAYRIVFDRAVRRARRLIAVSNFTFQELEQVYGPAVAEKTAVILEAVDPLFSPRPAESVAATLKRYGITGPYFLYIGNAKEHKNVPVLLEAFAGLEDASSSLVLISSGPEARALRLPPRALLQQDVPDEDLPALLTGAEALVTASLYEGFYLPALEARACGTPIIAPRSAAIPEVAGPEAILVEPTAPALRNTMAEAANLAKPAPPPCTWEQTAAETAAVLQDVCRELR